MARKQNDAPVKLIHILPGSERSPSADSLHSSPSSYQLGIEGSSHSLSNIFKFLKKLFPTSFGPSTKLASGLKQNPGAESLSEAQPIGRSRVRSWFEHVGAFIMSLLSMIRPSRSVHSVPEEDMDTNQVPASYPLLEGEAEQVTCSEVYPEYSEYSGHDKEYLSSDFGALRDQVQSQQEEMARVTSQLTDLKNLVLSQQQVLLHLGKEIEGIHVSASTPPPKAPRKTKPRATKATKPKTALTKKRPNDQPPSLEAQL